MTEHLSVATIGNYEPPHSTENELAKALLACGHMVEPFQEGDRRAWLRLQAKLEQGPRPDVIVWTRTASELNRIPVDLQERTVVLARQQGIPVVGYHLDIWWGLPRAVELTSVPYFSLVDVMCTADGGHQEEWASIGVEHRWFPPAVSEFECGPTPAIYEVHEPVAFVGAWQGGYHPESAHRHQLVQWLKDRGGVEFWPRRGEPAVRGEPLRSLYRSVPILVGDSCDTDGRGYYCSDRIPETLGRGGFLMHPYTEGVTDGAMWCPSFRYREGRDPVEHGPVTPMFTAGEHLACWHAGDWTELGWMIEWYEAHPERRAEIAHAGREHVLAHHTYTQRMRVLVEMLTMEGWLP